MEIIRSWWIRLWFIYWASLVWIEMIRNQSYASTDDPVKTHTSSRTCTPHHPSQCGASRLNYKCFRGLKLQDIMKQCSTLRGNYPAALLQPCKLRDKMNSQSTKPLTPQKFHLLSPPFPTPSPILGEPGKGNHLGTVLVGWWMVCVALVLVRTCTPIYLLQAQTQPASTGDVEHAGPYWDTGGGWRQAALPDRMRETSNHLTHLQHSNRDTSFIHTASSNWFNLLIMLLFHFFLFNQTHRTLGTTNTSNAEHIKLIGEKLQSAKKLRILMLH